MHVPKLNFEHEFDFQIKQDKDTFFIYDFVRKNWFVLTPEEWVRQHWIHYFRFIKEKNISSMILEKKLNLNGTTKRIDLLITEKTKPKILLEFKAPSIILKTDHFEQIARYNSLIGAKEIIISNGIHHIFADCTDSGYQFRNNYL